MTTARAKELKRLVSFVQKLQYDLRDDPAKYKEMHDAVTAFNGKQENIAGVASTVMRAAEGARDRFLPFVPDELYETLAFVNRVRDHFGGSDAVANRTFLDLFNGYRRREVSVIDTVEGVEALFRGQGDLLKDFKAFILRLKAYNAAAKASGPGAEKPPPLPRASPAPLVMAGAEASRRRSKGKAVCCDNLTPETARVVIRSPSEESTSDLKIRLRGSTRRERRRQHGGEEPPSSSSAGAAAMQPSSSRTKRSAPVSYSDYVTTDFERGAPKRRTGRQ